MKLGTRGISVSYYEQVITEDMNVEILAGKTTPIIGPGGVKDIGSNPEVYLNSISPHEINADVCIYGGTSTGIAAAIQAS